LQCAQQQHIKQFVVPSIGEPSWDKQQQLKQAYPFISNAFGIHPWYCEGHDQQHIEQLEALLPQAVAIGECGLDFMPQRASKALQMWWFQAQLQLAQKHRLPLIIHSVKSADIVAQQLKKYHLTKGVIHGFSGSKEQAYAFIKLGFCIGIGSRLCHVKAKKMHVLAASLPLQHVLLETDAPFGLQHGERNQPSHLIDVAKALASLRNQDFETILATCSQNAKELFQL